MKTKKTRIWDVEIGYNYYKCTVIAKDYIEAGVKAIDLYKPFLSKNERFISSVYLTKEVVKQSNR